MQCSQLELFPRNALSFSEASRPATSPLQRRAATRRERLALRNRALVARKYYWEEIMRRRTAFQNALMEYADFYTELCRRHVTAKQLQRMFPSWKF